VPGIIEDAFAPAAQTRAQPGDFVLRAGLALLPGRGFVEDVCVAVTAGRIEQVLAGPATARAAASAGLEVIEAPSGTLLPGLFDSHSHLTFDAGPDPVPGLLAASDAGLAVLALHNAQLALTQGVTTIADCGARGGTAATVRDAVAAGRVTGPRILSSGAPITTTAGHCAWLGGLADTQDEVIRAARGQIAAGADFLKIMLTGGNLTPGSNPRMLQYSEPVMIALAAEARRLSRPLVAHAHSQEAILLAARAGVTVVAHGTCHSADGIALADPDIEALAASGTWIDPTITVGMGTDGAAGNGTQGERARIRQQMLPIFARMRAAGVPLLAGTDGGVTGVSHGGVARAILALQRDVGFDLERAILAGTSGPARALGIAGVTGSLAPGLSADLVLIDADLRSEPAALLAPASVWAQGRLVARDGSLLL
jgi:imidazolonepropionase-like amidohydrolase